MNTPQELDRFVDKVLAYKPKPKTKAAKRRARRKKREAKISRKGSLGSEVYNYLIFRHFDDDVIDSDICGQPALSRRKPQSQFENAVGLRWDC